MHVQNLFHDGAKLAGKTTLKRKSVKKRPVEIGVRQMTLEDLPEVWRLSESIFTPEKLQFTYRTWNMNELLSLFQEDPELCLVAEDANTKKIVGFALGTILKRPFSPWTYGYFLWIGVKKMRQRQGVGKKLYKELEKRFKEKGARIAIVDVEGTNLAGMRFVEKLGFKRSQTYIWYSKLLN